MSKQFVMTSIYFGVLLHRPRTHAKYTQSKANSLGVRGWIRNTERRTVRGELEGTIDILATMKEWLHNEGSPRSRIDRAIFRNEKEIEQYTFKGFYVRL